MELMQPKNLQKQRLPAGIDADQVLPFHPKRNVRPRTATHDESQPESERGSSFPNSRRESAALEGGPPAEEPRTTQAQAAAPRAWPNPYDSLSDLPLSLRQHFQHARNNAVEWTVEEIEDSTAMLSCFMTGIDNPEEEGKKVLKSIHYESALSLHRPMYRKGCRTRALKSGQRLKALEQLCH